MKQLFTLAVFILLLCSCKKEKEDLPDADGCAVEQRIGCACRDGSSTWFPQGHYNNFCRGRGGVLQWYCN